MTDVENNLKKCAQGDRAAFSRLFRSCRPGLLRYATGLLAGDYAAAEDAVDEAFIAIWQQAGRFDGRGHALGWMRRIVRNKAIDWVRKQREIPQSGEMELERLEQANSDEFSPLDLAIRSSAALTLRAALELLNLEQREAIWLCYFEERPLREIAETASCPENTIKTRLFHARKILKKSGLLDSPTQ
jgi:RNA polymerase sigma-70 factor, ECF subfamily